MAADVDLDFADREQVLKLIQHTPARQLHQGTARKHNSGVYVSDIPQDPVLACAAIDYETAESRGYFKIDFLNMGVYSLIRDPAHYTELLAADPPWERLWSDSAWASQLVHVGNYTRLLHSMRPDSIQRLAAFISIIRPGKAHLQNKPWSQIFASVWDGDDSKGFTFKKSHAISYSVLVTLHMNLINQAAAPA
jgi:hypothetical protein